MKKTIFLILAFFLLSLSVVAQEKKESAQPDLSGTWIFDEKKSLVDGSFKEEFKNYTLVIIHTEPEIKITRSASLGNGNVTADIILYTDKRREKNSPYFWAKTEETSKTFWKKGVLVREAKGKFFPNSDAWLGTTQKYILSEDGKTLTINGIARIRNDSTGVLSYSVENPSTYRWVFRKKE